MNSTAPAPALVPSQEPAPDAVAAGRARIDALDAQLVALVHERVAVSREIQRARLAAGGPKVVHAREGLVVDRWRAELGAPGSRIALALLELSRGAGDA